MLLREIDIQEYKLISFTSNHIFNSHQFIDLNLNKCEEVHFISFEDTKIRMFIVFGRQGNKLLSPFSAPFGGFECLSEDIKLNFIDEAISQLKKWAQKKNCKEIEIKLPPLFYNERLISKQLNSLLRANFKIKNTDLNYSLDLDNFSTSYINKTWRNAKKNLKISFSSGMTFIKCNQIHDKIDAYNVIYENRKQRGFPLRMSWEQVYETSKVISSDFFLVKNSDTISIGAAIVFKITPQIVQVIYWGDLPCYNENKTMNFLSYNIFKYYSENNFIYVDIGPSTENSIPNYGLCEFKESIGCDINLKFTLVCNLQ